MTNDELERLVECSNENHCPGCMELDILIAEVRRLRAVAEAADVARIDIPDSRKLGNERVRRLDAAIKAWRGEK